MQIVIDVDPRLLFNAMQMVASKDWKWRPTNSNGFVDGWKHPNNIMGFLKSVLDDRLIDLLNDTDEEEFPMDARKMGEEEAASLCLLMLQKGTDA